MASTSLAAGAAMEPIVQSLATRFAADNKDLLNDRITAVVNALISMAAEQLERPPFEQSVIDKVQTRMANSEGRQPLLASMEEKLKDIYAQKIGLLDHATLERWNPEQSENQIPHEEVHKVTDATRPSEKDIGALDGLAVQELMPAVIAALRAEGAIPQKK